MRGSAIFLMISLHVVDRVLNTNVLVANINKIPLINILVMIVLPFLGGMAGFFLLVSAIANMVSMYKLQQRGLPTDKLVVRQILTGALIVIFGMLTEGLIGYNGALGGLVRDLGGALRWNTYIVTALTRWNHFETIHTIGWCVILNGVIQGALSRREQWKNVPGMIRNYAIIAVAVVALTIPVWIGVGILVPGYPWAISPASGSPIYMPQIGVDNLGYILVSPFLAMLAAPKEPIFPYLAVSCVGSIIGIVMCQPPERIPKHFVRKVILGGLIAFVIGIVGIGYTMVNVAGGVGVEAAVQMYTQISFHRSWFPDNVGAVYLPYVNVFSWLWQFLAVNGFSLMLTMMTIFMVDWRGIGKEFANNRVVRFIRRFGFTSLTNYNNQWVIFAVWIAVSLLLTGQRRVTLMWDGTLAILAITLAVFTLGMLLWERVDYVGCIEWIMRTIGINLIPSRVTEETKQKWYEKGRLDTENSFYNVEFVSVVTPNADYHAKQKDSKIIAKISKACLFTVIFMPFNIFTLFAALDIKKKEGENPALRQAIIVSAVGTVITLAVVALSLFVTPKML